MDKGEIIWLDDQTMRVVTIGYKGCTMYKISWGKLEQIMYVNHLQQLTPEEVLKIAIKESQYIPFEEIK